MLANFDYVGKYKLASIHSLQQHFIIIFVTISIK